MNKPHKHAEVIKAWADGAQIQCKAKTTPAHWVDITTRPQWWTDYEYRVKPEPKPDIVRYVRAMYGDINGVYASGCLEQRDANIKLVFAGETHKLKSVELIDKE